MELKNSRLGKDKENQYNLKNVIKKLQIAQYDKDIEASDVLRDAIKALMIQYNNGQLTEEDFNKCVLEAEKYYQVCMKEVSNKLEEMSKKENIDIFQMVASQHMGPNGFDSIYLRGPKDNTWAKRRSIKKSNYYMYESEFAREDLLIAKKDFDNTCSQIRERLNNKNLDKSIDLGGTQKDDSTRLLEIEASLKEDLYGRTRIQRNNLKCTPRELANEDLKYVEGNISKLLGLTTRDEVIDILYELGRKVKEMEPGKYEGPKTYRGNESKQEVVQRLVEIRESLNQNGAYGKDRIERYGYNVSPLQLLREDVRFIKNDGRVYGGLAAFELDFRVRDRFSRDYGKWEDLPKTFTGKETDDELKIRIHEIKDSLIKKGEYGKDRIKEYGYDITPVDLMQEDLDFIQCHATRLGEKVVSKFVNKLSQMHSEATMLKKGEKRRIITPTERDLL